MYRLEFEQAVGHPVSDEEYRKAELVLMNTKAIIGTQQIAYIYEIWGTEAIDILYSLVEERGKLIESLGEARKKIATSGKRTGRLESSETQSSGKHREKNQSCYHWRATSEKA